jgi:hypothetical protein
MRDADGTRGRRGTRDRHARDATRAGRDTRGTREHRNTARVLMMHARKTVRAGVEVRARAPLLETPWQIKAKEVMDKWLRGAAPFRRPGYYELAEERQGLVDSDATEYADSDEDEAGETFEATLAVQLN